MFQALTKLFFCSHELGQYTELLSSYLIAGARKIWWLVILFFFLLWGWSETGSTITEAIYWPTAPAPDDDGWWWVSSSRWHDWQRKLKYLEKSCPSDVLSTTIPTWPNRTRTRASAAGSQRLTAWATARPKICNASSGIEPATFQLTAYCLNQLRYLVSPCDTVTVEWLQEEAILCFRLEPIAMRSGYLDPFRGSYIPLVIFTTFLIFKSKRRLMRLIFCLRVDLCIAPNMSESKLYYDYGQSASMSWCQALTRGTRQNFLFFIFNYFRQLLDCWRGKPSLTRGLVCS
jgi:hypothetical protein